MKTALISGGLGFIGSFIARQLVEDNVVDKIVLLDHFGRYVDSSRGEFLDYRKFRTKGIEDRIIIERGEARYYSVISNIMERYRPELIYHLAALPLAKLPNLVSDEAIEGCITSTSNLLEIAGKMKKKDGYEPKRFIYASSSMVYGDFLKSTADEEHPTNPKDIYGTMKLAGEQVTKGLSRYFGIKSSIIRPSAVYGPTDMNRRVSQIFLEKAIKKQKISIQGVEEKLDFSYVKDVAKGFVLVSIREEAIGETFNITYGRSRTLLDFAMVLKNHFPGLKYEIKERDTFRPLRGTLSIKKAKTLLGYKPDYDLEKGVDEYIKFIKENNPNLSL